MSWVDVENATQTAIALASGYAQDRVFWSYQNVNSPNLDFITIHFGGEIVIGIDSVRTTVDLTRPNGQELKQELRGVREVPLELSCFTTDRTGDLAARRVLEKTRTRLQFKEIRGRLRNVGMVPFDLGAVDYVPDIPSTRFRGRATCTLRCYVPVTDCIDYVGYISAINVQVFPQVWTGPSGATGFTVSVP